MKIVNVRKSVLTALGLLGVAGLASMNVACGSDTSPATDGGTGGAASGTGGSTGGGTGGAAALKVNYTFNTATQGWVINNYCEPANLGGVSAPDAAVTCGGTPAPTATHEPAEGSPATPLGALKITVTFSDYNQYVDAIINQTAVDLTGRTLKANVQLLETVPANAFTGGVQLHASTTSNYYYGNSTGVPLVAGTWTPLSFPLNIVTTAGWDPAMVVQIGVQFYSGMAPSTGPATLAAPFRATFLIDTVTD